MGLERNVTGRCGLILIIIIAVFFTGCGKQTGTIIFTANGEDFIREGFIDKTGWNISFENVFVNIVDPTAYMPETEGGEAVLEGAYWTDLAAGDENAEPVVIGEISKAAAGNYQSLKFGLKARENGEYKGFSVVMMGTALKGGESRDFLIKLTEEILFDGKEGYVGDSIKGILKSGESTTVEMTFHFDHIFGDNDSPAESHINTDSVGFGFFEKYNDGNRVDVIQETLVSADQYEILRNSMLTLGHLGEGHCKARFLSD